MVIANSLAALFGAETPNGAGRATAAPADDRSTEDWRSAFDSLTNSDGTAKHNGTLDDALAALRQLTYQEATIDGTGDADATLPLNLEAAGETLQSMLASMGSKTQSAQTPLASVLEGADPAVLQTLAEQLQAVSAAVATKSPATALDGDGLVGQVTDSTKPQLPASAMEAATKLMAQAGEKAAQTSGLGVAPLAEGQAAQTLSATGAAISGIAADGSRAGGATSGPLAAQASPGAAAQTTSQTGTAQGANPAGALPTAAPAGTKDGFVPTASAPAPASAPAAASAQAAAPAHAAPTHAALAADPIPTAAPGTDKIATSSTTVGEALFTGAAASDQSTQSVLARTPAGVPQAVQQHAAAAVQQVAEAIKVRTGEQTISIRLDPAELGNVTIDLTMDKGRTVYAVVSAEQADTNALLRKNLDSLQRELEAAGFEDVNVDIGEHNDHPQETPGDDQLLSVIRDAIAPDAEGAQQAVRVTNTVSLDRIDLRL